jgi:hypothetical protein
MPNRFALGTKVPNRFALGTKGFKELSAA